MKLINKGTYNKIKIKKKQNKNIQLLSKFSGRRISTFNFDSV